MTEQPYTADFSGSGFGNMTSIEAIEDEDVLRGGEYEEMWQYRFIKKAE